MTLLVVTQIKDLSILLNDLQRLQKKLEYIQLNQREKKSVKKTKIIVYRHLYRKSSAFETANKKNIFNSKCVFCW